MPSVKHLYKFTELNADARSKNVTRMNKKNMIYTLYYCNTEYNFVIPDWSATPSLCLLI